MKKYNVNTTEIKQNLLFKLQDSNYHSNTKSYLSKFSIEQEREDLSDKELEEKLNYILDPTNNIKKEQRKAKTTNSCKCAKTGCNKFSCNCLRNNLKCDFLCSCKNCQNRQEITKGNEFLSKKTLRN